MIKIDIFFGSGVFAQSQVVSRVPVEGDYLEVDGKFYQTWKVFLMDQNIVRVQLGTVLSLTGQKNEMFYS